MKTERLHTHQGKQDKVIQFDNVPEFVKCAMQCRDVTGGAADDWHGGLDKGTVAKRALSGDRKLVSKAEKVLERLEGELPHLGRRYDDIHDVTGTRVDWTSHVLGRPKSFIRRSRQYRNTAPVRIVVSIGTSAAIDPETMLARGITTLALLIKIQESRPVDLYLMSESNGTLGGRKAGVLGHYIVIKVDSNPLELATTVFAVSHAGFYRHLMFDFLYANCSFHGGWPNDYISGTGHEYWTKKLDILGLDETQDVLIREAYAHDEMIRTPEVWLAKELERITGLGDSD